MIKRLYFVSLLLLLSIFAHATAPVGYYNSTSLDGKNGLVLRSAFQTIISNGQSVPSYSGLWTAYGTTDLNSSGYIWDMYSNCVFNLGSDQDGGQSTNDECAYYNREHTTPKSWFGSASPMYSDLFNVYPTDKIVNAARGNLPYGEVGSATYTSGNGSLVGASGFAGYSGEVFEPIDEYKGDFARTCFYMATIYSNVIGSWVTNYSSETEVEVVYDGNNGLTPYAINLFLKWSREDPVSDKERNRNDAVYNIQNNRNPFIDFPQLEEYIWGNKTSVAFSTTSSTATEPTVNNPISTNITVNSATVGGSIASSGSETITESGIYYSTTSGFANGTGTKVVSNTTSGSPFTVNLIGLNASTTYYFKAYAKSSAGTGYSSQASFSTLAMNASTPKIFSGNPINHGSTLLFGQSDVSITKELTVKTSELSGDLEVSITGTAFGISTSSISKAQAESGFKLTVTFQPATTGNFSGTLSITGGGLNPGYQIQLSGSR